MPKFESFNKIPGGTPEEIKAEKKRLEKLKKYSEKLGVSEDEFTLLAKDGANLFDKMIITPALVTPVSGVMMIKYNTFVEYLQTGNPEVDLNDAMDLLKDGVLSIVSTAKGDIFLKKTR